MSRRPPSKSSPYWISKYDHRTAVNWCLRYNEWVSIRNSLPDTYKSKSYDAVKVQSSGDWDATADTAIDRLDIDRKINLLETTAKICMPDFTEYLIKGVTTEGVTIEDLVAQGMPYSRNAFITMRQKFYYLISKKI